MVPLIKYGNQTLIIKKKRAYSSFLFDVNLLSISVQKIKEYLTINL